MLRVLCLLLPILIVWGKDVPVVKTSLGTIEGHIAKTVHGKDFYSFKGIPYAKPPIGDLRFKEAVPVEPWVGTWKANNSYTCLQYTHFPARPDSKIEGEEDCLYLNVFTPTLNPKANLDVLVYIHGGAFMFGSKNLQGPEILQGNDIVQVNMNYRLGPIGFLSTEDEVVPGNNGIKDQILALKWIKDNIKYFGGNPNSVTISGMSAGGASVHVHYLIPQSKGLFHRGISQSGTALNPWVFMEDPLEQAQKLATLVGCPTHTNEDLVNCLKTRPGRKILDAVVHFQPFLYNPFSPFGLVVDTWAKKPLFGDTPYNLIKNKKVHDVPWIASYTAAEGLYPATEFYQKDEYLEEIDRNWNDIIPHVLHYNFTVDKHLQDEVSQKIRQTYLGDAALSKANFLSLVDIISDRLFKLDIGKTIELQSAAVKSDIYVYKFSYRGTYSVTEERSKSKENLGASHADDTCYVFKTYLDTLSTEEDRSISNVLVSAFVSFTKTGKPTISNVDWTPMPKNTSGKLNQLHIINPDKLVMETVDSIGNKEFWDTLPFEEHEGIGSNKKDEL